MRPAPLPARPTHIVRTVAAITLLAGFADLARGGVTFAPVALAVGYLILVPAVLATWR